MSNFKIKKISMGTENQFVVSIDGWLQGSFISEKSAKAYMQKLEKRNDRMEV